MRDIVVANEGGHLRSSLAMKCVSIAVSVTQPYDNCDLLQTEAPLKVCVSMALEGLGELLPSKSHPRNVPRKNRILRSRSRLCVAVARAAGQGTAHSLRLQVILPTRSPVPIS